MTVAITFRVHILQLLDLVKCIDIKSKHNADKRSDKFVNPKWRLNRCKGIYSKNIVSFVFTSARNPALQPFWGELPNVKFLD